MITISIKKLKYDRYSVIQAGIIPVCDKCNKEEVMGLEIDTSGGEYGVACICFSCIEEAKESAMKTM